MDVSLIILSSVPQLLEIFLVILNSVSQITDILLLQVTCFFTFLSFLYLTVLFDTHLMFYKILGVPCPFLEEACYGIDFQNTDGKVPGQQVIVSERVVHKLYGQLNSPVTFCLVFSLHKF